MNDEVNADTVIGTLGRQIAELVIQLAVKDAHIEQLTARLQVQAVVDEHSF